MRLDINYKKTKGFLLRVAGKSPSGAQECGEVGVVAAQETGTRFPLASVAYVFGNFISCRPHVDRKSVV